MLTFFPVHADAPAGSDQDILVVEGMGDLRQAVIGF
jgi:hypothetical protein